MFTGSGHKSGRDDISDTVFAIFLNYYIIIFIHTHLTVISQESRFIDSMW